MCLQVLFGTGLLGIVLSLGTFFGPKVHPNLGRLMGWAVRVTTFLVIGLLLLACLDRGCGLTPALESCLKDAAARIEAYSGICLNPF